MPLTNLEPVAFIPTANAAAARAFYESTLGLTFVSADDFATVFLVGPSRIMLRITNAPEFTPLPVTIFGWGVADIHATVAELTAKGVQFERYGFLQQEPDGVWNAPGGAQVAWFKDPDGNTLSLSSHPA
jgi:catechol 2,3-dioxygenase-like lactoylglutathione lyase family enzyme